MQIPTEHDIRQHQRLEALYEATSQGTDVTSRSAILEHFDSDREAIGWLRQMKDEGLVDDTEPQRLAAAIRLSPEGVEHVRAMRDRRDDRGERRRTCPRRLLAWTDKHSDHERDQVNALRFKSSPYAWFHGTQFDWDREIVPAIEQLDRAGLVVAHPTSGWHRVDVTITPEGQECGDLFDFDPAAYAAAQQPEQRPTYSIENVHNSAFAFGQDNATVSASATHLDLDAALLLAHAAREALPVLRLTEDERADAEQALADIEQREDEDRVRSGLRWFGRFSTNTAAGALGQVLGMAAMALGG